MKENWQAGKWTILIQVIEEVPMFHLVLWGKKEGKIGKRANGQYLYKSLKKFPRFIWFCNIMYIFSSHIFHPVVFLLVLFLPLITTANARSDDLMIGLAHADPIHAYKCSQSGSRHLAILSCLLRLVFARRCHVSSAVS